MSNNIDINWPTYIAQFSNPDHKEIKNELISFFEDYIKKNPKGRNSGENLKLYESTYDLHLNQNESYKKLLGFMSKAFLSVSNFANQKRIKELKKPNFKTQIINSWFIKYEKGGSVLPHSHGNCSWSCVYYVQIDNDLNDKEGYTFFEKPYLQNHIDDFGSKYDSYETKYYKPEEGSILIWPGHIRHGSIPFFGKKNRIIVSANANIQLEAND